MPFATDFTQVKGLDPVPEGWYTAKITDAEEGKSGSGNPKITYTCEIIEGEYTGRKFFDILSFHPDAMFRTAGVLRKLGWDKDFAGEMNAADLVGLVANFRLGIEEARTDETSGEEYNARNKVKSVKASDLDLTSLVS